MYTILTVDDDELTRNLVRQILCDMCNILIEADNGFDALNNMGGEIDLIITDFRMPIMDGLEFVRNVRMRSALQSTPIIMLTGENLDDIRKEAEDAGVTELVGKSVLLQNLRRVVKRHCQC